MKKLLCLLLLLPCIVRAQDDKPFSIRAGLDLRTTATAASASDSDYQRTGFVTAPFLRVFHRSGWGIGYQVFLLPSAIQPGLYLHSFSGGYEQYGKGAWDLNFTYTHYFFTGNPSVPLTPLTNELYAYASYQKSFIAPVLSAGLGFGTDAAGQWQSDLNLAGGFSHDFVLKSTGALTEGGITPALLLNASTANFVSFLNSSKYLGASGASAANQKKGKKGNGSGSGNASGNPFALNNVELNIYSYFTFGSFEITPSGSLYVPLKKGESPSGYGELRLSYYF